MSTPSVSVVIAAYDAEDYIDECVHSVLTQTLGDLELIVVNDGSTDSTRQRLQRFERDHRMRIIDQDNAGCSAARNRGAARARSDYIAIVDADDVCWPEKLERQLEYIRQHPDLGAVGTQARLVDHRGRHLGVLRPPAEHREIAEGMKSSMQFCHATTLIRADVFWAVGGYEESYPTSEDYQLLRRIVADYRCANLDEVLADVRIHAESKSFYYFEQQRFRSLLTRHLMARQVHCNDEVRTRFGGDLSRTRLIDAGVDRRRIDEFMIANYIHRIQMLDRIGRCQMADEFFERARTYIDRHNLGASPAARLRALQSLRALRRASPVDFVASSARALAIDPRRLLEQILESGRYTLHRWKTKHRLATPRSRSSPPFCPPAVTADPSTSERR